MSYKSDPAKADRTEESADFPAVVLIDNTSACNLRCSMCDHKNIGRYRNIRTMDPALYRKLIDEIAHESPQTRLWPIFFGEAFLCRDMAERIAYAKQKGLTDVVLNSNGVLMTPSKSEAVIRAGLDAMYVGIDSASREIYDQIRVGGDFEAVIHNVLAYKRLLDEVGRPDQKLFVQFVVSEINEHEVPAFKSFWIEQGVAVKIRPKLSWAGLVEANNLSANDQVERKPCYFLMRNMCICEDGQVALCAVDPHCRVECGDASRKSLKELWQAKLKRMRALHREGRWQELPAMCRNCRDWQSGYAEFETPMENLDRVVNG